MKKLGQSAVTTGSGTLLYTVPTGYKCDVNDIIIANTASSPIAFTLHFVASGGSATTANQVFPAVQVPGNTVVQWTGNQTLNTGDFVQGIGGSAGITVTISGTEYRPSI